MMGLFASLLGSKALNVNDERLWSTWVGPVASSGVAVSPESAMTTSAVWACVRLIAESMATMPLIMYRRRSDGGRERATGHPLYDVFHSQPNRWQTAFEFIEMLTGHVLLRGNAYARIMAGPRGPVDHLVPLHPDRVTPEQLADGTVRYRVTNSGGVPEVLNDEDVFHLRGLSSDGLTGMSVVEYARESIGLSIAAERYGARFFGNDSRPGGILKHPGQLSNDAAQRLRDSWEASHTGANQGRVAVLEEGLEWQQVGIAPEDAQFLQTREFQVEDVARWFRVPLHMIQQTSKVTSWGTGIEQQQLAFQIFTLLPWARRWEQALARDLILATRTYYAEFLLDALIRADQKSRYDAYAIGRNWGWLSVNDIRQLENMNPVEHGDTYLQPLNMLEVGQPAPSALPPGRQAPEEPEDEESEEPEEPEEPENATSQAHYRLLLTQAAARIIRKEQNALQRAAARCNGDGAAWETTVTGFFDGHGQFVADVLGVSALQGELYALGMKQRALELGSAGIAALWSDSSVPALAQMAALGEKNGYGL